MLRSLVQASVKNEKKKIEEVLRYLTDLRESWEVAIKEVKKERPVSTDMAAASGWTR
jgi:flagellin-specific chaperone FliS